MRSTIHKLFNEHKLMRRLTLGWACWLITVTVLRVTEPEVLKSIGGAATATIVTAVIGILATMIGFYQWSRKQEDAE